MRIRCVSLAAAAAVLFPLRVVVAQQNMTEFGAFAQYNVLDRGWQSPNATWAGARVGRYLTDRFEMEFDGGWGSISSRLPGTVPTSDYMLAMRITHHVPFYVAGVEEHVFFGMGLGTEQMRGAQSTMLSPDVGLRLSSPRTSVSLRLDGVMNWSDRRNTAVFAGSQSSNFQLRAGLSYTMFEHLRTHPVGPMPITIASTVQAKADSASVMQQARSDSEAQAAEMRRRAEMEAAERRRADSAAAVAAMEAERMHAREVLAHPVSFDYARAAVRPDQVVALDAKVEILRADPNVRVKVEGFTDPRGSAEYNQKLGMRRAMSVKQYLTSKGVDPKRIDIESYGKSRPVCQEKNESCWSRDRRTEYVVITASGDLRAQR